DGRPSSVRWVATGSRSFGKCAPATSRRAISIPSGRRPPCFAPRPPRPAHKEPPMPVSLPTPAQLKAIAAEMNLSLTDSDVDSFIALMKPSIDGYNVVDRLPDNLPPVKYPRTPGVRPPAAENRHNAWYVKSRVEGASQGPLKGKTVVLKDNVMLAGVPMMNGASTLEGYVPDVDATIVTRILDAGGTVLGKAHC